MSGVKRRLARVAHVLLLAGGVTGCGGSSTGDHGFAICLALRALAGQVGGDDLSVARAVDGLADEVGRLADTAEDDFGGSTRRPSSSGSWVPTPLPTRTTQPRRYLPAEWCETANAADVYDLLGWNDDAGDP